METNINLKLIDCPNEHALCSDCIIGYRRKRKAKYFSYHALNWPKNPSFNAVPLCREHALANCGFQWSQGRNVMVNNVIVAIPPPFDKDYDEPKLDIYIER